MCCTFMLELINRKEKAFNKVLIILYTLTSDENNVKSKYNL